MQTFFMTPSNFHAVLSSFQIFWLLIWCPANRSIYRLARRLGKLLGMMSEGIKQGKEVLYRSIIDLVRNFMKDEAFNQQDKTLRRYLKPDLVIIDDMGLKALPKQSGEYLLEVIMRRYENRSTIMTSNRPLEDWGKLLSDVPTAGAILDRFLHHAITIAITGRSYRVKDSLPAQAENKKRKTSNEPLAAEAAS